MAARCFGVIAVTAALAACQPAGPATGPPAGAILILGNPAHPAVGYATERLAERNERLHGRSQTLSVTVRDVRWDRDTDAAVRQLLPEIDRFRLIFTPSQTVARAAQLLIPDRPIVFEGVDDPVANCLVDSLARPGRNATGYMHLLPDSEAKMLELLLDGFPRLRRVVIPASGHNLIPPICVTANPSVEQPEPPCIRGMHGVDALTIQLVEADRVDDYARRRGVSLDFLVLCEPEDFRLIGEAVAGDTDVGFLVPWHSLFADNVDALVAAVEAARRPAIFPNRQFAESGGLLSLEPILDLGRDRASVLALMQVIEGRSPSTLPVQRPRGFESVFNAGTASRQGLRPSAMLLHRVDRILP